MEGAILRGKGHHILKYSVSAVSCAKVAELIEMPSGIWYLNSGWPKEPRVRYGSRSPCPKLQFLGERTCQGMPNDTVQSAVQKWLNRSRCRLGCGLGLAKEACVTWRCALAKPGEYDSAVHVRRPCKNG